MAEDLSDNEELTNIVDEESPEEGEIQDDSSDDCYHGTNNSATSQFYGNVNGILRLPGSISEIRPGVSTARVGYPACVQEFYAKDSEKSNMHTCTRSDKIKALFEPLENRNLKMKTGTDHHHEKENRHGSTSVRRSKRLRSSRSLESRGSPSPDIVRIKAPKAPENGRTNRSKTPEKSHIASLRKPDKGYVNNSKTAIKSRVERLESMRIRNRKRRHSSEEKKKNLSNFGKKKVSTKNSESDVVIISDSSDIEIQIQKTKKRLQNEKFKSFRNESMLVSHAIVSDPGTETVSSTDGQDLNKSSSSVEVLDIANKITPPVPVPTIASSDLQNIEYLEVKSANFEEIKTSNKLERDEELLLRLEALRTAIQKKYGDKRKELTSKQKQFTLTVRSGDKVTNKNNCQAEHQETVEAVEVIDVEPVDMELSLTDDEQEDNQMISVVVSPEALEKTYFVNPPLYEERVLKEVSMESEKFEVETENYVILNEFLGSLGSSESVAVPMGVAGSMEEDDEELLRAQLLIAIANKQQPIPHNETVEQVPLVAAVKPPPTKPVTMTSSAARKRFKNQYNISKSGNKLVRKDIYKNKKIQKLSVRNYKKQIKEGKRLPAVASMSTQPASGRIQQKAQMPKKETHPLSQLPVLPTSARIVIRLGEDTESEDEMHPSESQQKTQPQLPLSEPKPAHNFVKSVDQFLKQVRQDVEQKQQPKPSGDPSTTSNHSMTDSISNNDKIQSYNLSQTQLSGSSLGNHLASVQPVQSKLTPDTLPAVFEEKQPAATSDGTENTGTSVSKNITCNLQPDKKSSATSDNLITLSKDETVPKTVVGIDKPSASPIKLTKKVVATKFLTKTLPQVPVTRSSSTKVLSKTIISTKRTPSPRITSSKSDAEVNTPRLKEPISTSTSKVASPLALQHLPSSQQMEYHLLKLEIARREELMKLKLRLGKPVPKSPKDREILFQDQPKLKITVSNDITGEDTESVRTVTQSLPQEDLLMEMENIMPEQTKLRNDITIENVRIVMNALPQEVNQDIELKTVDNDNSVNHYLSTEIENAIATQQSEEITANNNVIEEHIICNRTCTQGFHGEKCSKIKNVTSNKPSVETDSENDTYINNSCPMSENPVMQHLQESNNCHMLDLSSTKRESSEVIAYEPQAKPLEKKKKKTENWLQLEDEKTKELGTTESKLLTLRQELLQKLMSLAALLGDVEIGQAVSLDAEARVEALRRELARAEARAEEQRTAVKKLFSQVGQVRVEVAQARSRCAGLAKTCLSMGQSTVSPYYHLPQEGADLLKTHLQQVVELTKKTRQNMQPQPAIPFTSRQTPAVSNPVNTTPKSMPKIITSEKNSCPLPSVCDSEQFTNPKSNLSSSDENTQKNALSLQCDLLSTRESLESAISNEIQVESEKNSPSTLNVELQLDNTPYINSTFLELPKSAVVTPHSPYLSLNPIFSSLAKHRQNSSTCSTVSGKNSRQEVLKHSALSTPLTSPCETVGTPSIILSSNPVHHPDPSKLYLATNTISSGSNQAVVSSIHPYKSPLVHMKQNRRTNDSPISMDPHKVLCPYALTGSCLDDECTFQHPCSSLL